METTEYLLEKINHLRQQVQNDKIQVFVNDLAIADASEATVSDAVNKQLGSTADSVKQNNIMLKRRLAVREPMLKQLEEEMAAQKAVQA